ncbi:MAG: DUF2281 domain-containing protein [Bacteroidota bacterium]|nr:DUF2281 domain-containing protein [Bacteroidota bacterium]
MEAIRYIITPRTTNLQIILPESLVDKKLELIILTFDENKENGKAKRIPGALKGKVSIPDDFNEPLEDLNDLM